ncbi:exonuclease domain-containing protein [Spirosoma agri]|uniref:BRCT domain-containing protein n=1 Tax=Spirosoma agri TaxID=1987381 RepID=A0A6M0IRM6_9BACT|nr:exonuclease domain-containing protein [Spirosoma agri]NEU70906.1 hypothetical protein [Spirosoma agri]
MNFVAIDFETANDKRMSACSLGLAVVRNGQITDTKYWIIRPEPFEVGPIQQAIHGFSLKDLADKPTFKEIWPEVNPYLQNQIVVAHNASFDLSVLKHILTHYETGLPDLQLHCTVRLAKAIWKEELLYSLSWLALKHNLILKHHHALDDAKVCAQLLLLMLAHGQVNSVESLCEQLQLPLRTYDQFGRHAKGNWHKVKASSLTAQTTDIDPEHILFEKYVAFTGTLESYTRQAAQQLVTNIGGIPLDGVTGKTNYLVIGNQDFEKFGAGFKSSKLQKAEKMIKAGQDLEIINEQYFMSLIR